MDQLKEQQPGTSQQGDGAIGGVVTEDRKRQIQQQLALLLHAHKCNRPENPNREVCNVNYCKDMKAVLAHMGTCRQYKDCTTTHCASSRTILLHYKTCINSACIICHPFRQNHSVFQNGNVPTGGGGGGGGEGSQVGGNTVAGGPVTAGPGGPGSAISDDRKRQIQQQLLLLLHAHKCNRRESLNPNRELCNVNYCKAMKTVLAHMGTCRQYKDCTTTHCSSSRTILLHFKTCRNSACIICHPFRQNHSVFQNSNVPPGEGGGEYQDPLLDCIEILKDLNINADDE